MDILDAIRLRRSVRSYLNKDVEEDKLIKILDAGRLAPSASNCQEWRFVVVRDKDKRKQLSKAAKNQRFVEEAPVVIAACAKTDGYIMTCGEASYPIDVAISIDHMTLAAVSLGLGTCWVGAFFNDEIRKILDIPSDIKIVQLLALGYPKDKSAPSKQRLSLKEIAFKEVWGKALR